MDLIKRDSEYTKYKKKQTNKTKETNKQKKLSNRFSNDIGHFLKKPVSSSICIAIEICTL